MRLWILPTLLFSEEEFQYRKRYEVTCDGATGGISATTVEFQYRKRYEVTCDDIENIVKWSGVVVSIPQAV